MPTLYLTTGLFPVPNQPAAAGPSLTLLFSSHQDEDAMAAWSVYRSEPDGAKVRVRSGTVQVPGQGMAQVVLRPAEVEGRVIEVNVRLPSRQIVPSAAVVISFLADDTRQLALWLSPGDFALRRSARFGHGKVWRLRRRSGAR